MIVQFEETQGKEGSTQAIGGGDWLGSVLEYGRAQIVSQKRERDWKV